MCIYKMCFTHGGPQTSWYKNFLLQIKLKCACPIGNRLEASPIYNIFALGFTVRNVI